MGAADKTLAETRYKRARVGRAWSSLVTPLAWLRQKAACLRRTLHRLAPAVSLTGPAAAVRSLASRSFKTTNCVWKRTAVADELLPNILSLRRLLRIYLTLSTVDRIKHIDQRVAFLRTSPHLDQNHASGAYRHQGLHKASLYLRYPTRSWANNRCRDASSASRPRGHCSLVAVNTYYEGFASA